jgi:ABC-type branched-subunit amino acid transport system ATPase component
MAEPLLRVQGVSIAFGGLRAVQDVSLDVAAGTLSALIGPNGAGKTTLFALMSGFLRPDSGRIRFDGHDITGRAPHLNARAGMTRTFQIVQPFAAQTVRENIAVGAHLHEPRRARGAGRRPRRWPCAWAWRAARQARRRPHRGRPQAAGAGACAGHAARSCCCSTRCWPA